MPFFTALVVLALLGLARGCRLHGTESGICVNPDDKKWGPFADVMPFCGASNIDGDPPPVTYRACLPLKSALSPGNHTVNKKDLWVKEFYNRILEEREMHERNETLEDAEINELGEAGGVAYRFTEHKGRNDCKNAFKNFFCWMNFPRCDEEDHTLMMCRSACENLHKSCGYDKDMYRCGDPEYLYGYVGESPWAETELGKEVFFRYPYPGAPFRDNQFEDGEPVISCTPSLRNAAGARPGGAAAPPATVAAWLLAGAAMAASAVLARA